MGKYSKPKGGSPQDSFPEKLKAFLGTESEDFREYGPEEAPEAGFDEFPEIQPEGPVLSEEEEMDRAFMAVSDRESNLMTRLFGGKLEGKKLYVLLGCAAGALVALCIALGLLIFGGAGDPYDNLILNNVNLGGIHVGGLTRSQAEDLLSRAAGGTYTQQDMVLVLPDTSLRFSPKDTGAKLDVSAAVKAAWQYGRTGSDAERQAAYQNSLTGSHTIALLPYLKLNQDYIRSAIQGYADSFGSDYRPSSYQLEGELPELQDDLFDPESYDQTLVITLGTPGLGVDVDTLFTQVLDGYSFNTFLVEAKDAPPSSTPEKPDLQAVYEEFYIEPVSQSLNLQNFETIPGSFGRDFDLEAAQRQLDLAADGEIIRIPMRALKPEENEDAMLYQDVLGYCETPHSNNEKRTQNLKLVCQLLDGLVLMPGDVFSYNDSVGERTTERGFQPAPAYSGTRLVDSVGGGVCQGSSTIYYASLLADMEIVDRINHGFPSSYIEMGMDATVSWGGPDFKFRNSSNYPIQIKAEVSGGYMKMWIMGTEERDYYIKMTYKITGTRKPDTFYEEYGPDSGYYDGQVLQAPATGYLVKTFRCKYDRETDELISEDFETLSSYMVQNAIVAVIIDNTPKPTDPPAPPVQEPSEPTPPPVAPDPPTGGGDQGGDGESGGNPGGSGGGESGGDPGSSGGGESGGDPGSSGGDVGTAGNSGDGGSSGGAGDSGDGGSSGNNEPVGPGSGSDPDVPAPQG